MTTMLRLIGIILVLCLSACDKPAPQFINTDLTGLDYAKDFALTDHNGKARTLADFKGKAVAIFLVIPSAPMFALPRWQRWLRS